MKTPDCGETTELLSAFEANELDAMASLGIQNHLDACQACRARLQWERELSASLRRVSEDTPPASAALKRRLLERQPDHGLLAALAAFGRWLRTPVVWVGASAAAAVLLLFGVLHGPLHSPRGGALWDFVSVHVRTTAKAAPAEIATSDPVEAENWLRTRLPFVALAPRTVPAGYRLLGARICRAGREPAGVLIYDRGGQRVSCFIQPPSALSISAETRPDAGAQRVVAAGGGREVVCGTCRGVGFAAWKEGALNYVLVANLPEDSLLAFAGV